MNKTQIEQFLKIVDNEQGDFDIKGHIAESELAEIENVEDLSDYLDTLNDSNNITNEEVIYYKVAIDYLAEEDPSLSESLEIAKEYGYLIDQINSELLATLLKTRRNEELYSETLELLKEEAKKIFNVTDMEGQNI